MAMKRTLQESLVDYDMAMLRALAETRGAVLSSNHRPAAAEELAGQLATPASLAIALSDLSPEQARPLAVLRGAGGWMEAPRFARRFGTIRVMGPGRLERERPWLSPANPAEALWYRGLIFKGFRQAETGPVEVLYVPEEVLSSLADLSIEDALMSSEDVTGLAIAPAASPARVQPATDGIVEDLFGLLITVRNRTVRVGPDGSLNPNDLQIINALSVSPLPAAHVAEDNRLAFIVRLGLAAGLLTVNRERMGLNAERARAWLQAAPADRLTALQTAWRDDAAWNDLWHVPSLKPQPTGWKNDPVLARQKVLELMTYCHRDQWYDIDEFIKAVKSWNPDFQRPDGDYTSWYIHDLQGESLMGFEHWDAVEGALLRYLLSGPLHWLGFIDLGYGVETEKPIAFRAADSRLMGSGPGEQPADDDLRQGKENTIEAERPPQESGPSLTVQGDFTVRVDREVSLYTRFQLARFADFVGRETDYINYRISPASLARARHQGIIGEQISSFLARHSAGSVPARVLDGLQTWYNRSGTARLEQGIILRVDRPEILQALRKHPEISPLLGEVLGPQTVLVPRANVESVRRWLLRQGYLEDR